MRVVVNIPQGSHPELFNALANTPPRERAERFRLLATMGLIYIGRSNSETNSGTAANYANRSDMSYELGSSSQNARTRQETLKTKLSQGIERELTER